MRLHGLRIASFLLWFAAAGPTLSTTTLSSPSGPAGYAGENPFNVTTGCVLLMHVWLWMLRKEIDPNCG